MTLLELIEVPGITLSGALMVYAVGYTSLDQLKDRDAVDMYDSVMERVVLRTTDYRLIYDSQSRNLKKEISNLPGIPEVDEESMSILAGKLSREKFGQEKRQILMNALRLAAYHATLGRPESTGELANSPNEEKVLLARYLAIAHISSKDMKDSSPGEIYDRIFRSVDLVPETATVICSALGLPIKRELESS